MTFDFTLRLIDKTVSPPTLVEDLKPFFNSIKYVNTGNERVNNGVLNLDIPSNGKFVRSAPVLIDEFTKVKFLLEFQITQGATKGKLFRADLGQPSIIINETGGEVLSIPMNGIEYIAKENLYSTQDLLIVPKQHFENVLSELNISSGLNGGTIFAFDTGDINLPDQFKLNWEPFAPRTHFEELAEVIERLADATVVGGTLRDFYFDFEPSLTVTRLVDVIAEEFGEQDSGVIIDPTEIAPVGGGSGEQEQQQNTDNVKFKNTIILKGDSGGGSMPMEHARFASQYLHGIQREEWRPLTEYNKDDLVRETVTVFPQVRFFKAVSFVPDNIGEPKDNGLFWEEDFSIDPLSPVYFSYTPWTIHTDDWFVNSVADRVPYWSQDLQFGSAAGLMVDWNIARTLYDREQPDDYFDRFSVKWVTRISNDEPTAAERFDGQHILVGPVPTGNFINHKNQIAHYNREGDSIIIRFSENPTFVPESPLPLPSGTPEKADIVIDLSDGKVKKFNGTTFETIWSLDRSEPFGKFNPQTSSPLHMIKEIRPIDGATGLNNQAVEFFFEWGAPPPFTGDARNFSSNGMWWHMMFPFPREVSASGGIGHEFGENKNFPLVNATNLDRNKAGLIGWHRGLASEDMGKMSAFRFKLKTGIFTTQIDDPNPVLALGKADLPFIFWAMDKFDRVYFHEFNQRFNNQWESHSIPIGFGAGQQLYHSRIDEYASVFGFVLPFNFFIPEREFTGVEFDWRFVKMIGIFYKEPYDDKGLYIASTLKVLRDLWEYGAQLTQEGLAALQGLFTGQRDTISLDVIIRHATLAIDEIYFEKELYASSNEGTIDDPRVELVRQESEADYLNARALAEAHKARAQFFPQQWNLSATGDVRLRLGQRFKVRSSRVPSGEQEMVPSEITHTINSDGYFVDIYAIRKFVIPAP